MAYEKLADPYHDKSLNPVWKVPVVVEATRNDHTMSLIQGLGTAQDRTLGLVADFGLTVGGLNLSVTISKKKKNSPNTRYTIDLSVLLREIFLHHAQMQQTPIKDKSDDKSSRKAC